MLGFKVFITDGRRGYWTRIVQPDMEFAWLKAKELLPGLKNLALQTYGDGPWRLIVQSGRMKRATVA